MSELPCIQLDARDFQSEAGHIQIQKYWDADGYHVAILTEPPPGAPPETKPRQWVRNCPDQADCDFHFDKAIKTVTEAHAFAVANSRVDKLVIDVRTLKLPKGN